MDLTRKLADSWPPGVWRSCHVVVAVSGGADSVALLRAIDQLHKLTPGDGQILAAHFNHRLRGDESDQDAAWVQRLASQLEIRSAVGCADEPGSLASEAESRTARYAFLANTAQSFGARYVLTAHTADDQVETVLMRVLRGSGIDGLAGTPKTRALSTSVTLVRPMLDVRRSQVEAYLASLGQDYRTDASNLESQYTRNWVRRELLPAIRDRLPSDPDRAILRLAEQAGQWRDAVDSLATQLLEQHIRLTHRTMEIDTAMDQQHSIVVQQACRLAWRSMGWTEQAMGMCEWQKLAKAIQDANVATFELPGQIQVSRQDQVVVLAQRL